MIKTYIVALTVVLLAGAHGAYAQESMDDVLADLDAAQGTGAPAAVETAPAGTVDVTAEATETEADAPVAQGTSPFDRAVATYRAGDYDMASRMFKAILANDPYDKPAMSYLQRTAAKISALEQKKQLATRAMAISKIEKDWNQKPKVLVSMEDKSEEVEISPKDLAIQAMEARVKGIMIPSLDFRDANVKDVVLFLSETCRRLDKESGKGVNMLLLGMNGSFDETANNVTISIRDMSLFDALKYISEMAKLKFEIQPSAIAIMPISYAPASEMVLRSYDVSVTVGEELAAGGSSGEADAGADDLFGDSSASSSSASGPTDVAGFFSIIDFPEGATAVYQPNFKKLFVKNTPQNLKGLEDVLADMEDRARAQHSQQVEIEAKFVEFNEGAMDELGFDWSVYGSGSVAGFTMKPGEYFQKTDGYYTPRPPQATDPFIPGTVGTPIYQDPVSGYKQIQPNNGRVGQNLFGGGMRTGGQAFEKLQTGILSTMTGSPAAMIFGNGDVDLRISALEQEGTADVLSAPKVTTKSGNEAIIRIVEVHRYPQDYDVETGQRTAPVVKPQDWEDFDLGVALKVTPVIDTDSNTIDLDLQPEITKFKGFDNYVVGYNAYDAGGNNNIENGGDGSALLARMPYFEKRSIQTQVTIADGSTVLMGGLVDERTETFRDQVPFLGDIPYLGRLFRTEGSRSQKKNLVIYVKATQVDDHGMTQTDRDMIRQATADS